MADYIIWASYKAVFYPLDLDKTDCIPSVSDNPFLPEPTQLRSLVDLCSEKIVYDSTTTSKAVEIIPVELCYSLMRAALLTTRDRSIEVLISKWPWHVLSLRKLAPALFGNLAALHSEVHVAERMRRGVKYTTCLAHTFVECLKKRMPTKLKYLDLSGYPAAEVIVNYLSSHVLLVYNEARQKEIISLYNNVTQDWPKAGRCDYDVDTTLPNDTFLVCVDAFVQSSDTHMELCRALKTSVLDSCRFRLRVQKLDLTCLGVARITVLLEQIEQEYLTALSLQFNGLNNDGMTILAPAIQRLQNLTALDLGCNNIALSHDPTCDLLSETLSSLPQLKRLNLSNNRLKFKVRRILSGTQKPLEYLKLCACGLSGLDIQYLSLSHHIEGLKELDLSENCLGRHFTYLQILMKALSGQLIVLEMEDCDIEEDQWVNLFSTEPYMKKIRYLNVRRNDQLNAEPLMNVITQCVKMKSLEVFCGTYPSECYPSLTDDTINEAATLYFSKRTKDLVDILCERDERNIYRLCLKEKSFS